MSCSALVRGIAALLFSLTACTATQAQTYPSRPITIVAPFPPGASTDFMARLLREPLAEALGQSIVVENRPGAGGTTGTAAVASAAPRWPHAAGLRERAGDHERLHAEEHPVRPEDAFAPSSPRPTSS